MADTTFRSKQLNKAFHGLGFLCLVLLMHKACAREFQVGGSKGWTVLPDNSESYNQWAERNRFQIGDSLVFSYPADQDSVLHVTSDAYTNCSTDAPIEKFTDGHTTFTFNHSGPHYFISGNKDNCLKNEKFVVIVMADRSNRSSTTNQAAPPSPPPSETSTTPSPAPVVEGPSPPAGVVEINPSPNAASSISMSFISSIIAAFVASSLVVAL